MAINHGLMTYEPQPLKYALWTLTNGYDLRTMDYDLWSIYYGQFNIDSDL